MSSEPVLKEIKKIRAKANYEKKVHYNAADLKSFWHQANSITSILLSVFVGSTFFQWVNNYLGDATNFVGAVSAFAVAALVALSKHLKLDEAIVNHRIVAQKFMALAAKCDSALAKSSSHEQKENLMDSLRVEYEGIVESAIQFPTSNCDYKKAKEGIESGEETFTKKDLSDTDGDD